MGTPHAADVAALDRPEVLERIFHPRAEPPSPRPGPGERLSIPVAAGVCLDARFHPRGDEAPTLLFFHGNGEIVADYDDLGPWFASVGANFLVVDYRGYGRSTGVPTASALVTDSQVVFEVARDWLRARGRRGPIVVAGRSLGSVPALELAGTRGFPEIGGLLVESGFGRTLPLLRTLGVDPEGVGIRETDGFGNIDKIRAYTGPTLIIHGERDRLIPPANGRELFEACGAVGKRLLVVPGGDHNTLFAVGAQTYLAAVEDLVRRVSPGPRG